MIDVEKYVENGFSGCVFLKAKDNFRFAKAYGYADLANKTENNFLTKFPTASAGKAFIAVGILQLIENGLLSFDDTIGELLDFDLKKIDESITIRNLLAHTSGMENTGYYELDRLPSNCANAYIYDQERKEY